MLSNSREVAGAPAAAYLTGAELEVVSRLGDNPKDHAGLRLAGIAADLLDGTLGGAERELVTDVLLRLLSTAQADLRQLVSTRVARSSRAPRELVLFLANDDIGVARPVLMWSDLLQDDDLMDLVRGRSVFHGRTVARRLTLSELVGETLVDTGDSETIAVLLQNVGARLSPRAALNAAMLARTIVSLQAPLFERLKTSPENAKHILQHVSTEVRTGIGFRFGQPDATADNQPGLVLPKPRQPGLVYANGGWTSE